MLYYNIFAFFPGNVIRDVHAVAVYEIHLVSIILENLGHRDSRRVNKYQWNN